MVKTLKETKAEIEARGKKADELLHKVEKAELKFELPDELKGTVVRLVDWLFNTLAVRLGEHWKLQPDELETLAGCYVALGEKYLPEGLKRFSVETNAILWTGIILLKRIAIKQRAG